MLSAMEACLDGTMVAWESAIAKSHSASRMRTAARYWALPIGASAHTFTAARRAASAACIAARRVSGVIRRGLRAMAMRYQPDRINV